MPHPDAADTPRTDPIVPALTPGLQVLDADPDAGPALQALVADHVLLAGGDACWIDPGSQARTAPLVDVAPSGRILDRIQVARRMEVPVLLTRREADTFSAPVRTAADRTLRCEATRLGPRFHTDDGAADPTLVYPVAGSGLVQTTLTFWERVLSTRHPQAGATGGVTARGAD